MPVSSRQACYLDALGVARYERRELLAQAAIPAQLAEADSQPPIASADVPPADITAVWSELAAEVAGCTACPLSRTRKQTVFGVGDRQADWLIIGEAPGAEEDATGVPFVGRAGKLLDAMLRAVGLNRQHGVYITNIVKCRPPGNRDPAPDEAGACSGYLQRQIMLINPKLILAVGKVAAHNLLESDEPVGRLRGRVWQWRGTDLPVVVTYHPAYLLRSPLEKRKAWDDLCLAQDVYRRRAGQVN